MIKYKLTTREMTTHKGHEWVIEEWQSIDIPGTGLCTDQVFHFYDHPLVAGLMNPQHGNIPDPLLWEVEINAVVAHDGTKGGCKKMRLLRQIPLPVFSCAELTIAAILLAKTVYKEAFFTTWADNWLNGADRSEDSASMVANDAEADALVASCAGLAYREFAARAANMASRAVLPSPPGFSESANRSASWSVEYSSKSAMAAMTETYDDNLLHNAEMWSTKTLIPILEGVKGQAQSG